MRGTMATTESSHLREMFNGVLERFSAPDAKPTPPAAGKVLASPADTLTGALTELQNRKRRMRDERARTIPAEEAETRPSEEEMQKRISEIHARIKQDILALHKTLH